MRKKVGDCGFYQKSGLDFPWNILYISDLKGISTTIAREFSHAYF